MSNTLACRMKIFESNREDFLCGLMLLGNKFLLFVFLLAFLFPINCLATEDRFEIRETDNNDFDCKVTISDQLGVFTFVGEADENKKITWNSDRVGIDQLEHAWIVHIKNRIGIFDLGLYKYKTMFGTPSKETEGTIERLSEVGQTSIYRYLQDDTMEVIRLVPGEKIYPKVTGNNLRIVIEGENILITLFADQPSHVNLWVISNNEIPRKCRAKVLYQ